MTTNRLDSTQARRTLDDRMRDLARSERQYQNARYQLRIELGRTPYDAAGLMKAVDTLDLAEVDHNLCVALAEMAHDALIECELAEEGERVAARPYVHLGIGLLLALLVGCGAGVDLEPELLGQSQLGVRHFAGCGESPDAGFVVAR